MAFFNSAVGVLQTLAEARAASGRFLNYGKQHKKIRVRKTLGLADFGGSESGFSPHGIARKEKM